MRVRAKLYLCLGILAVMLIGSIIQADVGPTTFGDIPDNTPGALLSADVIQTDQPDYAPGDTVFISGSGYWPNESVTITVTNIYNPGLGDEQPPWDVVTDGSGSFTTFWVVTPDGVDQTFLVTAEGLSSGTFSSTTFTDANTLLIQTVAPFDTTCAGSQADVCVYLAENCGGGVYAPMPNRPILFFINTGNCGNDVAQVPDDTVWTDENGLACATLNVPGIPGVYSIRTKYLGESKPGPADPPNSACDPSKKVNLSASNACEEFTVVPANSGNNPIITIPDSTIINCYVDSICIPVLVTDNECDIDTVYSNLGAYAGTLTDFDQINRYSLLGATITQVGGGAPGTNLTRASDFVAPVNALSGVSLTLPNFTFAASVSDYGSFPSGTAAQSADQLLGSPTDLTFTLDGAGGPDGGDGDGSVDFSVGNYVALSLGQEISVCDGSNTDLVLFTSSGSSGDLKLLFKRGGYPVYTISKTIPSATAGSGTGGLTIDLTDGIMFDEIELTCETGSFAIDGLAARSAPSASLADLCFVADTSGVYTLIVTAEDKCFNISADTAYITVSMGSAPVADAGADFSVAQCGASEVCFNVSFTDADNDLDLTELTSGTGTLTGNQICFTPVGSGVYDFIIHAVDSCGSEDFDTVSVAVTLNQTPVAVDVAADSLFFCLPVEICDTLSATDPDGGTLTWTHLIGSGTVTTDGIFCFTPTVSGDYSAMVVVSDSCGLADTVTIDYNITLNSAPVAFDPPALDLYFCTPEEICYQFNATDVDGGSLNWTLLSGTGAITSNGYFCFTPTANGSNTIQVIVTDSCGAADTTSKTINYTFNDAPTIALGNDTTIALCETQELCFPYTVSDPQGLNGLTETMISGYGTIDSSLNQVCFTPTVDGSYEFIVSVTDSCGEAAVDTLNVTVSFGASASISCPVDPIAVSLCAADTVCEMITIAPASASVTTSFGTYSSGQLCFFADTSGVYIIDIIVDESCGSDTCQVTFNVDIGSAASITCPPTQSLFICATDTICIPVGINGAGVTVNVSPIGYYQAGNICFAADTSGHYEIEVIAQTSCGDDTCLVVADIIINSAPVAVEPLVVDTFICDPAAICYQLSATDVDGGTLTWSRLSGAGTVSATGEFCFSATATSSYSVTAEVVDSCGAADTVTVTYNVTLNSDPALVLGNDTTVFLCATDSVCLPYLVSDADDNISTIEVVYGGGAINALNSEFCLYESSVGVYQYVLKVTDLCGKEDFDTINVTIDYNSTPTVYAGVDQNIFQCVPAGICLPITATDINGNLAAVELIEGPGVFDGTNICFTPTETFCYEFVIRATDDCGLTAFDTVAVCVTLNEGPLASAGADQTLFQCAPTEICWPANCSDPDGNLASCNLVSGPGTYNGTDICFTPTGSGQYQFVIEALDDCGVSDLDTVLIDVVINSDPVCNLPADTIISQCLPTEVCLPVSGTDSDDNFDFCQIVSGPGSIINGEWCYTPTISQVVTVTVRCEDSCGAFCEDQFSVEFKINRPPVLSFAPVAPQFLCDATELCLDYSVTDPDDPQAKTFNLLTAVGTLDEINSQVCFTPDTSGTYTFILEVTDDCGAIDTDTLAVEISLNLPPLVDAGADQNLFLCAPVEICWPASAVDPDNNMNGYALTGPGTFDGSQICFTPATSGSYQFILSATDNCGATAEDTVVIEIDLNSSPSISFGNDTTVSLCAPQEFCFDYTVGDPDGLNNSIENLISTVGTLDDVNNQVCFTPTVSGVYEIIVNITDSCGLADVDTVVIDVTFGDDVAIDCPVDTIDVFLCAADNVCQMIGVTPSTATVSTTFGTYSTGELCFYADTAGLYTITLIADETCGSDTCMVVFNVEIGEVAQISCPPTYSDFLCQADTVCIPVGINGAGVSVNVSPIGYYQAGNVCFVADTAGHYEIEVIATTDCGSDTCLVIADIGMNSPPIAVDPPVIDTFVCGTTNLCYQFSATDVDGGTLTWSKLNGAGTISSVGELCLTVGAASSYTIDVMVTDECGTSDTASITYNVTLNGSPVITLANDTSMLVCAAQELCFPYSATDVDNNLILEEISLGLGVLDTLNNTLCFTPDTAGLYSFIVSATDGCGSIGVDTLLVNLSLNTAPVVNAGADQNIFQCTVQPISWPATVTDAENNISSITINNGTYDNSQISFTPTPPTTDYQFILSAEDYCGEIDTDTINIHVDFNSPPQLSLPADTTVFQCTVEAITLPINATDPNNNFSHYDLIAGPGSIVGNEWVYTPTNDQSVLVIINAVDSCGAVATDTMNVNISLNKDPVVTLGDDLEFFLCSPEQICFSVTAIDPNNNLSVVQLLTAIGTYNVNTKQVCFVPEVGQSSYTFIVQAIDACGAVGLDTLNINIIFNSPPTLNLPTDFIVYLDYAGEVCFNINSSDPDDNLVNIITDGSGTYNSATDQICLFADTSGVYCLTVWAVDACGLEIEEEICVTIQLDECIHVQVENSRYAIQGQIETVRIFLNGSGKELGGYDLLVSYDQTALSVSSVLPGDLFTQCGWEYFSYRLGSDGNCGNGCPSGLLRVVAIAEMNNGGYHPDCYFNRQVGDIAKINFLVTNDRTMECQHAEIKFFWEDCGDNTFSSRMGDTLWMSRDIFEYEGQLITNYNYGFPGYFGAYEACMEGGGAEGKYPIRCVDYTNGGIDIICADSIDAAGDINLNEIANEIADAVLYSNYFIYGLSVFDINIEGQIAASDVNKDGLSLSVADLVYLIRIITGDELPYPKINPDNPPEVEFNHQNNYLSIASTTDKIGAVSLTLEGDVTPKLHDNANQMEMQYSYDGEVTRVLVYNIDGKGYLETGAVLRIDNADIVEIEVGSYDGMVMSSKVTSLPDTFELLQNYPNPFNPVTTIKFALPVASDWNLTIYNILGQQVEQIKDKADAGFVEIEWDGSQYASGIYFYRFEAGTYSATKKMVLLK